MNVMTYVLTYLLTYRARIASRGKKCNIKALQRVQLYVGSIRVFNRSKPICCNVVYVAGSFTQDGDPLDPLRTSLPDPLKLGPSSHQKRGTSLHIRPLKSFAWLRLNWTELAVCSCEPVQNWIFIWVQPRPCEAVSEGEGRSEEWTDFLPEHVDV